MAVFLWTADAEPGSVKNMLCQHTQRFKPWNKSILPNVFMIVHKVWWTFYHLGMKLDCDLIYSKGKAKRVTYNVNWNSLKELLKCDVDITCHIPPKSLCAKLTKWCKIIILIWFIKFLKSNLFLQCAFFLSKCLIDRLLYTAKCLSTILACTYIHKKITNTEDQGFIVLHTHKFYTLYCTFNKWSKIFIKVFKRLYLIHFPKVCILIPPHETIHHFECAYTWCTSHSCRLGICLT